jgi:arsenite oxidase small subunit
VALAEVGIGVATLLGVLGFWAALGGLAISAILALSASWRVYPYFLGSDSIYAIAWLTLALAIRERRPAAAVPTAPRRTDGPAIGRRELLRGGVLAAAIALGATAAAALGFRRERAIVASPSTSPSEPPSDAPGSSPSPTSDAPHDANAIATLATLAVGDAVGFQASDGTPCALVRLTKQDVVAFSRVCTHQGCLVQWDRVDGLLACPCHGAVFDPANGAEPVRGPAYRPLPAIDVVIQGNGDITTV